MLKTSLDGLVGGAVASTPKTVVAPRQRLEPPDEFEDMMKAAEMNDKMICLLASTGEPADSIAKKLTISLAYVNKLIQSEAGAAQIIKMQSAMYPDPQARVKRMAHMALDVKAQLMLSCPVPAVKNAAATDILDRSMGKPVQITENRNLNVNVNDTKQLDAAIAAQQARLGKLAEMELKLRRATPVQATSKSQPDDISI